MTCLASGNSYWVASIKYVHPKGGRGGCLKVYESVLRGVGGLTKSVRTFQALISTLPKAVMGCCNSVVNTIQVTCLPLPDEDAPLEMKLDVGLGIAYTCGFIGTFSFRLYEVTQVWAQLKHFRKHARKWPFDFFLEFLEKKNF